MAKLFQICSKCISASNPLASSASEDLKDAASLTTADFLTKIYSLGQSKNASTKP